MTKGAVLMMQGTTSSAGKSFLVAGLCRMFLEDGISVAPFKSQNMSNNAAVTAEGHEIGRAQAMQAQAAGLRPYVDMNPVLLKPEADHRSQVIVNGRPYGRFASREYQEVKQQIWGDVTAALERLRSDYELVVIEGAGSPAEINLKARDISNMKVALYAQAPVLIVGDIDRGGVFAHLYGTYHLLEQPEKELVKGFIINRIRGDASLLDSGLVDIERLTTVPVLGVVPWIRDHGLPEEDSVALDERRNRVAPQLAVDIAVIKLPRIANFDDFDPLEAEADAHVRYVENGRELGNPDLVIIPGSKSTIGDLEWLRAHGFEAAIREANANGALVVGICGGLQMLGGAIEDPEGVESSTPRADGLGMLAVATRFVPGKTTRLGGVQFGELPGPLAALSGTKASGYEIHAGASGVDPSVLAGASADGSPLAAVNDDGTVLGCYLHGMFQSPEVRQRLLTAVAQRRGKRYAPSEMGDADAGFSKVAGVLRSSLNLPAIYGLIGREAP